MQRNQFIGLKDPLCIILENCDLYRYIDLICVYLIMLNA